MRKFLIKSGLYALLFFVLVNSISFILNATLAKSQFYKPLFLLNRFKEKKAFNYIILGSSRGLTTLDSKQIDQYLKVNGVNLSMDDTGIKTHLLMMEHFFYTGFKAKNCILVLDYSSFVTHENNLSTNDYQFVPLNDRPYVQKYYSQYEESFPFILALSNRLPFLAYSYYNLELVYPALLSIYDKERRYRFDDFGNYSYPGNKKETVEHKDVVRAETKDFKITNPIINEFVQLAKRNNCKLTIYIAPYKSISINLIESKFQELDIVNHSGLIREEVFFYDELHVNYSGREIATNAFIEEFRIKAAN